MIITPLLSYQKKALTYLKSHSPCAEFLPLGTGKSLIALAYAEHIEARRILITSDKNNIINTWPDEIYRHTDYECDVRPEWIRVADNQPICTCINYDLLTARWKMYSQVPWDLWIGDESLEFKDQRTDKHTALNRVVRDIPYRLILNGTPMTERLEDLFGQFKILDGGEHLGKSITQFRLRYMNPDNISGYGWLPQRSAYSRVRAACSDVCYWVDKIKVKMPKRHYHKILIPMTKEQKRIDDDLKKWFAAELGKEKIEVNYAASLFIKRLQLSGGVFRGENVKFVHNYKVQHVQDIITHNPNAKIVVWHSYIPETELLQTGLKVKPLYVMDSPERVDQLKAFKKCKRGVLLIRTALCKGINQLADADIAIFYSNPLSYARRAQAEGRSRRITSKTDVTHFVDIVTTGGADELVYHMLEQKKNMSLTINGLKQIFLKK